MRTLDPWESRCPRNAAQSKNRDPLGSCVRSRGTKRHFGQNRLIPFAKRRIAERISGLQQSGIPAALVAFRLSPSSPLLILSEVRGFPAAWQASARLQLDPPVRYPCPGTGSRVNSTPSSAGEHRRNHPDESDWYSEVHLSGGLLHRDAPGRSTAFVQVRKCRPSAQPLPRMGLARATLLLPTAAVLKIPEAKSRKFHQPTRRLFVRIPLCWK